MRAGVIADSHWHRFVYMPQQIVETFKDVDIIFHLGDIGDMGFSMALEKLAPTEIVLGHLEMPIMNGMWPDRKIVEFAGKRIGLIHGHLGKGETTLERARNSFDDVDIIIYGHTHIAFAGWVDGVYMVNPGSLYKPHNNPRFSSIAILNIEEDRMYTDIIKLR